MPNFIGIDVGTGSARAGVFDQSGKLLATGRGSDNDLPAEAAKLRRHLQRRSVREAVAAAGVDPSTFTGFDAACSLVVSGGRQNTPSPRYSQWLEW